MSLLVGGAGPAGAGEGCSAGSSPCGRAGVETGCDWSKVETGGPVLCRGGTVTGRFVAMRARQFLK